jgi:hypothetical protein
MSSKPHATDYRYEVIAQEDIETGDILITLPYELQSTIGWKLGDDLFWTVDRDGRWIVTKRG